jgi:kynureninase
MNNLDANRNRQSCEALDSADTLAFTRQRFSLPVNKIYLDGNSLGALPVTTLSTVAASISSDWGQDLIGAWNKADWVNLPTTVGAKLAPLLGADANEVIIADSTSINIFKLLAGVLMLPDIANDPHRNVIISERDNFPTDLYIAEGINAMLGQRYTLKLVEADEVAAAMNHETAAALITQVNYRTGCVHDMAALNLAAQAAGTHIVWDLSHSAGAIPLELNADGAAFAIGCGYKYLNGGPGAPGYLYVAAKYQTLLPTPLSGWFGHKTPFLFSVSYLPADNMQRFLCGTPSVLATVALRCGIETFDGVNLQTVRAKSLALTDLFLDLMTEHCADAGVECISPKAHASRGSQLSFSHDDAYAVMQALIDRGVVGDFRAPNLIRFGFTPLYTRYVDCFDAVMMIKDVLQSGAWKEAKYRERLKVT